MLDAYTVNRYFGPKAQNQINFNWILANRIRSLFTHCVESPTFLSRDTKGIEYAHSVRVECLVDEVTRKNLAFHVPGFSLEDKAGLMCFDHGILAAITNALVSKADYCTWADLQMVFYIPAIFVEKMENGNPVLNVNCRYGVIPKDHVLVP